MVSSDTAVAMLNVSTPEHTRHVVSALLAFDGRKDVWIERFGVKPQTWQRWEKGEHRMGTVASSILNEWYVELTTQERTVLDGHLSAKLEGTRSAPNGTLPLDHFSGAQADPTSAGTHSHADTNGTKQPRGHNNRTNSHQAGDTSGFAARTNPPQSPPSTLRLITSTEGESEKMLPAWPQRWSKALRQELFLPVHKFVWFYPAERAVIATPAFQRLRLLNQLGLSYVAFPGATHRRFEHVLGTVAVIDKIIRAVNYNCEKEDALLESPWHLEGKRLTLQEQAFIRLAALLHDIGHLPMGHTLEDELGLIPKHDGPDRLKIVFEAVNWYGMDECLLEPAEKDARTSLSDVVSHWFSDLLDPATAKKWHEAETWSDLRELEIEHRGYKCPVQIDAPNLVQLIVLKPKYLPASIRSQWLGENATTSFKKRCPNDGAWVTVKEKPFLQDNSDEEELARLLHQEIERAGFRLGVARDMVGNTICADLLDYLHRDWYHTGKVREFDERIFQYMEMRLREEPEGLTTTKLVITIDAPAGPRFDGVSAILELLEGRYRLAETVLFHKTKLRATAMLDRAMYLFLKSLTPVPGDQQAILTFLLETAEEQILPSMVSGTCFGGKFGQAEYVKVGKRIAYRTLCRHYYRDLVIKFTKDFNGYSKENVLKWYRDGEDAPDKRFTALELLESDFRLPLGSIALYCPSDDMNRKVAEVNVLAEKEVRPLAHHKDTVREALADKHLDAQLRRFESLWRVGVYFDELLFNHCVAAAVARYNTVHEATLVLNEQIDRYSLLLKRAVSCAILGNTGASEAASIRRELKAVEWREYLQGSSGGPALKLLVARQSATGPAVSYPSGVHRLADG